MGFYFLLTLALVIMNRLDAFALMEQTGNQAAKLDNIPKTLENKVLELWEAIRVLESEVAIHTEEITVIKQDLDEADTDLKQAEAQIENIDKEIITLKKKDDDVENDISDLHSDMNGMRQDISDHNMAVAFTASIKGSHGVYSKGERIVFDVELSNKGYHYNSNTGEFICPVYGLYMFNIGIRRPGHKGQSIVWIKRGSRYVNSAFSEVPDNIGHHSSAMAIFTCDRGEKVYMEADNDDCQIYGWQSYYHSLFNGVLLRNFD